MRSRKNQSDSLIYPSARNSKASGRERQQSLKFDHSTDAEAAPREALNQESRHDTNHSNYLPAADKLWLACAFPNIALDAIIASKFDIYRSKHLNEPTVVYDAADRRNRIVSLNSHADTQGIHVGMSLGVAMSICSPLNALARDTTAETRHLRLLASYASKISSTVSILQHSLLMEIGGSIRLFGGLETLVQQTRQRIGENTSTMIIGCAPTPAAAVLLCHHHDGIIITTIDRLRPTLSLLPISTLRLDRKLELRLKGMGLELIGDLLRLPRDGLARRATPELLQRLDKVLGLATDLPKPYKQASRFEQKSDSEHRIDDLSGILANAKILLDNLEIKLIKADASINRLQWIFYYEDADPTTVTIELSEGSRDSRYFYELTASRLERIELSESVVSICLCTSEYIENHPAPLSLFPETQQMGPDNALIDRLKARLGNHAVEGLRLHEEHRPEYATHRTSLGNPDAIADPAHRVDDNDGRVLQLPLRPLWLLPKPRKLQLIEGQPTLDGPLQIAPNQERIESGWWETHSIRRDYYVAVDVTHLRVWIYRDLRSPDDWYLHGIFG